MLIDAAHLPTVTQNDIIVTNVRHYEALNKALEAIHRVQNGLDSQISGDFLSQDIRECIFFISDIAGRLRMIWCFKISFNIFASANDSL